MSGIGLLNEKSLHAALKAWYAQPGDRFEVPFKGFVIDIVRGDLLLEIQTRHFAGIKSKLTTLVRSRPVRLVYPIAQEKWIVRLPGGGVDAISRRRSTKKGRVEDLFREAVSIPQLLANSNFSLEVLLIKEEETRRYEGRRRWRTRGWITEERRLIAVLDRRVFRGPESWLALLPEELELFTSRDLADALGVRLDLAQKMAYSLREAGLVTSIGRRGRASLYAIAGRPHGTEPRGDSRGRPPAGV